MLWRTVSVEYVRITYEKTKGQVALELLLRKQNIQVKGVYQMNRLLDCCTPILNLSF